MHPKESTVESCKDAFKGKDITHAVRVRSNFNLLLRVKF